MEYNKEKKKKYDKNVGVTTSVVWWTSDRLRLKRCGFDPSSGTNVSMICKYLFRVWLMYHGTNA